MTEMENLYEILKIPSNASTAEIKRAFRASAKRHHPDVGGSAKVFAELYKAYNILVDPVARAEFDQRYRQKLAQEQAAQCQIDIATKIEIILAWSASHPRFNPSLISGFADRLAQGKSLTPKQEAVVNNVIRGFKIDVETWLKDEDKFNKAIEKFLRQQENIKKSVRNKIFSVNIE